MFAAGLMFERFALGDGVVLLGVGGGDFLAVDAALEDLDGGRVVGRELGEGDELLGQVRDEGGLNQRWFDELLEDGTGHFEVFVLRADVAAELEVFDGHGAALGGREGEPVGDLAVGLRAHGVADDVPVADAGPRGREVDGLGDLALGVFVLDDERVQHLLRDVADHALHQLHHGLVVAIGLVGFEHRELRVVLPREAFVAEVAANLKDLVHAAHEQALEVKLEGDAEVEVAAEGLVLGDEGPRRCAAGDGLHHGRLDLHVAARVEEVAKLPDDLAAQEHDALHVVVGHEVEVALAVAGLGVGQAVPLVRRRAQGFGEDGEGLGLHGDFAGARGEEGALDAHEVAEVEVAEDAELLVAEDVLLRVGLDASALVLHVDEHGLAHVAVRGDAAGDGDGAALGVVRARGGAGLAGGELVLKRVDAFGAQGGELGLALFDERIRVVHNGAGSGLTGWG